MIFWGNLDFSSSKEGLVFLKNITYVSLWKYSMTKCGITDTKMCKSILWIFLNALSQSQPGQVFLCTSPPPPPHISDCQHVFLCYLWCSWDIWMGGLASFKNSHGTLFLWTWSLTTRKNTTNLERVLHLCLASDQRWPDVLMTFIIIRGKRWHF